MILATGTQGHNRYPTSAYLKITLYRPIGKVLDVAESRGAPLAALVTVMVHPPPEQRAKLAMHQRTSAKGKMGESLDKVGN